MKFPKYVTIFFAILLFAAIARMAVPPIHGILCWSLITCQ